MHDWNLELFDFEQELHACQTFASELKLHSKHLYRLTILTSFAQDEAIRKSAFGLNFNALMVSSGGAWTSISFMGLSRVPRPRVFVVLEVEPNVPKLLDVPLKAVPVEPNMFVK